ncbi:hypothetical protein KSAC_34880 (plasmid) [Komagataeibacter saccharivorans]|nr:hypothetical protein KSAC_34880 [Komagataeibacter saccharivorans]
MGRPIIILYIGHRSRLSGLKCETVGIYRPSYLPALLRDPLASPPRLYLLSIPLRLVPLAVLVRSERSAGAA